MALTRLTLMACVVVAWAMPQAMGGAKPSPAPGETPVPFAQSEADTRYWPVVTDHPRAEDVSAHFEDGSSSGVATRRFNSARPLAPAAPARRHTGVDLFARAGDSVVAMEDGRIVAFYRFSEAPTGEMNYALLVAHDGYVANYGEVRATSLSANNLEVGDEVRAGQRIAEIGDTAQLHVETYVPGVTHGQFWRHGAPAPAIVRDPTALLIDLADHGRRRRP